MNKTSILRKVNKKDIKEESIISKLTTFYISTLYPHQEKGKRLNLKTASENSFLMHAN